MPGDEKRKKKCELCGKSPRVCRQLESGQWVCHTCLKAFRTDKRKGDPDAPATEKQIAFAFKLGVEILPGATKRRASKMITLRQSGFVITEDLLARDADEICFLHDNVLFYVMDLWEQLHGKRPKQVGIPWKDQQAFAAYIVTHHQEVAESCEKTQFWRDDVASERSLDYAEEHDDWEVESRDFKPPIPEDETFRFIAERVKKRWKQYRPGILSRLFGQ